MTGTMQDFIDATSLQGKEIGKDFAYVVKFRYTQADNQNTAIEAKVIWIPAGGFPSTFPPETTSADKAAGEHWERAWTIVRCAVQPPPTRISMKVGKFVTQMPNIKIEK